MTDMEPARRADSTESAGRTNDFNSSRTARRRSRGTGDCWRLSALAVMAALCIIACPGSSAQDVAVKSGGTYKYGHIFWTSLGNEVTFTIEAVFKRSNPTAYFAGSAPDGFSQIGDTITLTGRENPRFYFGDDGLLNVLRMTVTAYSSIEDWVMGEVTVKHTYSRPSDGVKPWLASFRGCCRSADLANNADAEWLLAAHVDLTKANMSPRAKIMPIVSVPFKPLDGTLPRIKVPAADPANRNAVEWSLATPWGVGNAAYFSRVAQSFLAVPLQSDFGGDITKPGFSSVLTTTECTKGLPLNPNSVSPGCFYRLLRTDKDMQAMTIEGWVKVMQPAGGGEPGGYILSVGADTGRAGTNTQCSTVDMASRHYINKCRISTLFIKANATHVTVGHDLDRAGADTMNGPDPVIASPAASVREVAFAICSHPTVCSDLEGSMVGKWVHIAVLRYQRGFPSVDTGTTKWFHSYKVMVNGKVLEITKNPGGTRVAGELMEYDPGESDKLEGPRAANTIGATCTCSPTVDWRCGCMENYAVGTALLFGAYKGAARPDSYFEGMLDEWRFWNGYRSPAEIVEEMNRKLLPEKNSAYGNPADPSIMVFADSSTATTKSSTRISTLMALYNFDTSRASVTTCSTAGLMGCPIDGLMPSFPDPTDERIKGTIPNAPGVALYKAYGSNVVSTKTDNQGTVFYDDGGEITMDQGNITLSVVQPGLYQIMAMVAMKGGAGMVPVDFVVSVVDASWDLNAWQGPAYKLCSTQGFPCAYPGNTYMPSLNLAGYIAGQQGGCVAKASSPDKSPQMTNLESFLYPCKLVANTGYNVKFQLQGKDNQRAADVGQINVDWRDTNVGFGVGPLPRGARLSTVKGTNPSRMDFSWTPCHQDVGVQTLCFEAIDSHVNRSTHTPITRPVAASEMKCVQIEVQADPVPVFLTGAGKTPTGTYEFTMGKQGGFEVHAADDNCLDTVSIAASPSATTPGASQLPPGAMLTKLDTPGATCALAVSKLTWTPTSKLGGFEEEVCFDATDMGGSCPGMMMKKSTHCITLKVLRCIYSVQMDEQIQDIATRFGMDWVRMWSLNPLLLHPDYIVSGGQILHVGHIYRSDNRREMPGDVAKRMGMSSDVMRDLNYGLDQASPLENGQEICVVPDSCKGMAQSSSSMAFATNQVASAGDMQPIHVHQVTTRVPTK